MGKIRIGLSGWSYDEWHGAFYPSDLRAEDRLSYVADRFDTVEVNSTFYGPTTPSTVRRWREATPDRFVFAVKGSRYITHTRCLREPRLPLANFFASGILELGPRLGPILWQLPPTLEFDRDVLDRFLGLLPHDTEKAAELAHEHEDRVGSPSFGDGSIHRIRHVLEFRHPSFATAEAIDVARRQGSAVACSHSREWPVIGDVTAGYVHVRLHGPGELYSSGYDEDSLRRWAERAIVWRSGGRVAEFETVPDLMPPDRKERDVYVFFDNTAHGLAPRDAQHLQRLVSGNEGS